MSFKMFEQFKNKYFFEKLRILMISLINWTNYRNILKNILFQHKTLRSLEECGAIIDNRGLKIL